MKATHQTRGIVLMSVAMLSVPVVDGLAKYLSATYSPLFIGWARYVLACAIVLPLAAARHGRRVFPGERLAAHTLRTVFLMIAMTLYFLAVARIPLATAATASFISPILAVMLSIAVLKERLTWQKLLSLILGFGGSLVILRPGAAIEPGVLLALGCGLFFALYMVATRMAALESAPVKTLAFQCVVGTLLLTPQALASWSTPSAGDLVFFAGLAVFSVIGHGLSIMAFRLTAASTLAPLVYLELLGATLIGYFVFRDVPDAATLMGAGLIIAGGLLLFGRSR